MFKYRSTPLHIIDNGRSVQIDVEPGSVLNVGDKSYQLVQFHFHHPSEELVNGKRTEMGAHLVHRDSEGKLAVVAVLLRAGQPNATVEVLWSHLPKQKEHEADFKSVLINPAYFRSIAVTSHTQGPSPPLPVRKACAGSS